MTVPGDERSGMYDAILLPTDGSDESLAAADEAFELADRYDATLHVVYVVDTAAFTSVDVRSDVVVEGLAEAGEEAVDRAVADARAAGVEDVVGEVAYGSPASTLIDYAEDHDVDLIVMATHGRGGIDRLLLGSVAERLVRSSPTSVLTVRIPENPSGSADAGADGRRTAEESPPDGPE